MKEIKGVLQEYKGLKEQIWKRRRLLQELGLPVFKP